MFVRKNVKILDFKIRSIQIFEILHYEYIYIYIYIYIYNIVYYTLYNTFIEHHRFI